MPRWKKIKRYKVLDHPRIQLVEDDVMLPDGTITRYIHQLDKKDYVTVIASYDAKIIMVRDYSYPNDRMLLQFPEGAIERDETAEDAALRELEEETGMRAATISLMGENLDHHRRSTATNFVLFTDDVIDTGITHLEAEESHTETVLLSRSEITDKIASGEIIQKNALAAWTIYCATHGNKTATK
jgi:ADP-ribose pyrophosphatase